MSSNNIKPIKVWDLTGICCSKVKGIFRKLMFAIKSVFFDINYYPITLDVLMDALAIWRRQILPKLHYQKDKWDCDDFAEYFASWLKLKTNTNCAGIVCGDIIMTYRTGTIEVGHAWVPVLVYLGDNYDIMFVEPQLGRAVKVNEPITFGWESRSVSENVIKARMGTYVIGNTIEYRPEFFIW